MKKYLFIAILSLIPAISIAEVPTAPQNVEVIPGLSGENDYYFDVSWEAPLDDNGVPGEYRVYNNFNGWEYDVTADLSYRISQNGFIREATEYSFYVTAVNKDGEGEASEIVTAVAGPGGEPDKTPPVISDLQVLEITDTSAVVSWATDELASSAISFDVHSADQHQNYSSRFLATEHSFDLTELLPCTVYFYYVSSEDASANSSSSQINRFQTTGCLGGVLSENVSDLIPPQVLAAFEFNDSVNISVQEGAFGADSVFQVKKLNIMEVDANVGCPANKKPVGGKVYDIKFLDDFNSKAQLSTPATISIRYEESELDGVNESDISMYHYNEGAGAWQKLDSCTLDTENNTVTCSTSDFSKFMLSDGFSCPKSSWVFDRYMFLGSMGKSVTELQRYLNDNGYFVSYNGKGSPGRETKFFGLKTLRALKDFQREYSSLFDTNTLEYKLGIFGGQTKKLINP